MVTFADTSGLYALLDAENVAHRLVAEAWAALRQANAPVVTSSYVLLETVSLVQSRLGLGPVRDLVGEIAPILMVEWTDDETHDAGVAALLSANRRNLSLVDCVSFEVMRRLGIRRAFTLDEHFRGQGFEVVP
jgi:predicted nucleic acid-binding protein